MNVVLEFYNHIVFNDLSVFRLHRKIRIGRRYTTEISLWIIWVGGYEPNGLVVFPIFRVIVVGFQFIGNMIVQHVLKRVCIKVAVFRIEPTSKNEGFVGNRFTAFYEAIDFVLVVTFLDIHQEINRVEFRGFPFERFFPRHTPIVGGGRHVLKKGRMFSIGHGHVGGSKDQTVCVIDKHLFLLLKNSPTSFENGFRGNITGTIAVERRPHSIECFTHESHLTLFVLPYHPIVQIGHGFFQQP